MHRLDVTLPVDYSKLQQDEKKFSLWLTFFFSHSSSLGFLLVFLFPSFPTRRFVWVKAPLFANSFNFGGHTHTHHSTRTRNENEERMAKTAACARLLVCVYVCSFLDRANSPMYACVGACKVKRSARRCQSERNDDAAAAAANAAAALPECSRRVDSTSDVVGVDVDRRRRALSRRVNCPLLQRSPCCPACPPAIPLPPTHPLVCASRPHRRCSRCCWTSSAPLFGAHAFTSSPGAPWSPCGSSPIAVPGDGWQPPAVVGAWSGRTDVAAMEVKSLQNLAVKLPYSRTGCRGVEFFVRRRWVSILASTISTRKFGSVDKGLNELNTIPLIFHLCPAVVFQTFQRPFLVQY